MERPFTAYRGDDPFVFVCYAHDDAPVVYAELARLNDQGVNIWYDEGIAPGESWTQELADAIDACAHLIFFVTPASVESRHCINEVQYAVAHDKSVLAVHLEPSELPGGLELSMGASQAILRYALDDAGYQSKLTQFLRKPPDKPSDKQGPDSHRAGTANLPGRSRGWKLRASLAFLSALIVAAGISYWTGIRGRTTQVEVPPLVAVLPFSDLAGDNTLIGRGIAEELLNLLARTPNLRVVSSALAFGLGDDTGDLKKVAQALRSDYIVYGSLRRDQSHFRVLAHLIDASTGQLVWSGSFEGELSDVFAAQKNIAMGVADALDVAVAFTSRNELDPLNSQAVEYYLQGQEILRTSSTLDSARQAQALFQRSLDVQPAFTLGTAGLCHALLLEFSRTEAPEHFERAKRRCLEALEQDGQSIQSRVTLGNLYNKVGDHAQAEAILLAAAAQSPYYERTYYHLARTYDALGRIEEAEAAFARSISLEPGFWGTYLGYGNFLARHQRYDEAIIEFRKITEIAPEEFVGYASMGASYFESGQLELAAEYIEKSLEINENSRSYFNLGLIHQSLGNYPQASDGFSRAVEMNPQNYRALMFLADVQEQAGDARLAVSTNRRALEVADGLVAINPADGYVLAHSAILLAGLGDNDEAKLRVEHAIELEATNPKVRFESAVVFESLGDRRRALAEMRTALRLGYPAKMFQSSSATTPFKNDPEIQQLLGIL